MSNPTAALQSALAGQYSIERELGQGGMATVYLAADVKHRRKVALKVLRPELAAAIGAERFLREIEITANLQHPHILPLHDSGAVAGTVFYVMPFVEGATLRARIDGEKQLPLEDAVRIAAAVSSALDYAHRQGVIHRDIKPENILLSGEHALVADFGIGTTIRTSDGDNLTQVGTVVGTPAYMSPEQATGDSQVDGRSDLYSVGVILFEMLTGRLPFSGSSAMAVLAQRLTEPAPTVRTLRAEVSEQLERTVARALKVRPEDRFATGADFSRALQASRATPVAVPAQPVAQASIAVLPFANLSADPDNEYFADGITDDVITQLAKIRALKVISSASARAVRTRSQSLREIGATLNVTTLLEGSVRRAGNRVRIVAQLIDAASERHLWAEAYDRDLTDIFAIQTDVALRIATALNAELSTAERGRLVKPATHNLQAYQYYLKGRQCFLRMTEEGIHTGIAYFERAIEQDPEYALGWAGLAQAYHEIIGGTGAVDLRPDEALRRAKEATARALEIDPDLGAAHVIQASLKFTRDFDWVGAERDFERAMQLDPGSADAYDLYGQMLGALERYDEALVVLKKAQELDPLAHRTDLANALVRAGRYEAALEAALPAIRTDPHYPRAHATLGWAYLKCGQAQEGIASLEKAVELEPADTMFFAQLGQAYGSIGREADARDVLRRLKDLSATRYVSPYHLAYVHVGLGEHDRALDLLEKAYEERAGAIYGIKGSFLFTPLRGHPRFTALLEKMNLV